MGGFKRSALTFIVTFLISALIFGIIAAILVPNVLGLLGFMEGTVQKTSTEPDQELISTEKPETTSAFAALLVGTDSQPKVTPGAPVGTDTMIFVTVSEETKTFVFMPLYPNLEVTSEGNRKTLKELYDEHGIEYLCEKVTGLTGIAVNYYAQMSMNDLADLIDSYGGVKFDVPVNMNYEDPRQSLVIDIDKGTQTLSGKEAVKMLRYRTDGNYKRMFRGVDFLEELISVLMADVGKDGAADLYSKLSQYVLTNFEPSDLVTYVDLLWAYSEFDKVVLEYPGEYYTEKEDGVKTTYLDPDTSAAYSMLEKYKIGSSSASPDTEASTDTSN